MMGPPCHGRYGVTLWSRKGPSGRWGSTSATIWSLKAAASAAGGVKHKGVPPLTILVKGKEVKQGEVTEENADRLQRFAFNEYLRPGVNEVTSGNWIQRDKCWRSSSGNRWNKSHSFLGAVGCNNQLITSASADGSDLIPPLHSAP
jgi:hypothetical protein